MIVQHEYPLSMVEHEGFRTYSHNLQPLFRCPSRNTTKSDILLLYEFEMSKLMKVIGNNKSRFAITIDMWTSNHQKRGFMVITAHYIDDTWVLRNLILKFAYVPCPHTSEALREVLHRSLMDWNVDRKVSTITVDNCSTNDFILKELKDSLCSDTLLLSGKALHMRCCAHILNLIVKDGLLVIKDEIDKIRDSVSFWTATPKRIENFQDTAQQLKVSTTKRLVLDCATQWNSTLLMLTTALSYKTVFRRLRYREPSYDSLPSEEEWCFASEICDKLNIFLTATKELSGRRYPTSSLCFDLICDIKLNLIAWCKSYSDVIKTMAGCMYENFKKYWDEIHILMGVSAVLDPRFKMVLVRFYYTELYGAKSQDHINKVQKACGDLLIEYQARRNTSEHSSSSQLVCSQSPEVVESERRINRFDAYVRQEKRNRNSVKSELDIYLGEDVISRKGNLDILAWWNTQGQNYPMLREMARDLLAIPASTVASESAFSTKGRLINLHRSRLRPETIEPIMCLQNWLANAKGIRMSKDISHFLEDVDVDDDNTGGTKEATLNTTAAVNVPYL